MKRALLQFILPFAVFTALASCSSSSRSTNGGTNTAPPTSAVIVFATSVSGTLPANTVITGYDLTFTLPSGVTVKSSVPPTTDDGVVQATGAASGSMITAVYSPATGAGNGTVRIMLADAEGFNAGEFSTVVCDIADGHQPDPSDFYHGQMSLAVSGYDTATDTTVNLTAELSLSASVTIQ